MAERGEVADWIEHIAFHHGDKDACLMWPFYRNANGYGEIMYHGVRQGAHRLMARLVHGEPPSPQHVAAHWCGHGKQGCVNPHHIRWATEAENTADKVRHQSIAGERHPRARLTNRAVIAIREFAHTLPHQVIADLFDTPVDTIRSAIYRKTWRHI
jgi:hypothetical protein